MASVCPGLCSSCLSKTNSVTVPQGTWETEKNPGDRNWCWTSWCCWIKSSHNKPWSASCLQDKWPSTDGSAITSSSNWMLRPLLLGNQWLRPSLPNPYLGICFLWSLFKFSGQGLSACHAPGILQGVFRNMTSFDCHNNPTWWILSSPFEILYGTWWLQMWKDLLKIT